MESNVEISNSQAAPVAWVTGAGSGLGQAIAVNLSSAGYHLILTGRRLEQLLETHELIASVGGTSVVRQLDVSSDDDMKAFRHWIADEEIEIGLLVSSAGFNVQRRYWSNIAMEDFEAVVNVNLNGVARSASIAIDNMKDHGGGTIIVVSSYSGWKFVDVAGPAYSATKTALGALVESINSEVGSSGVRATALCPGEVLTPIFLSRPNPLSEEQLAAMLVPEDVATVATFIASLPPRVCINEIVMTPLSHRFYDRSVYPDR